MTITTPLHLLKSIPCFADLSAETMEWLLGFVKEQSFNKGEIILLEGDPCPGLFVVKTGAIKLYRSSPTGDEQIMRIVHPSGCFECTPLFDGGPNPLSAQTLEASKLYLIPASSFELLVSTHPEIVLQFVPILAMRIRYFLDMVEDFSFRRVFSRVAKLLLQLGAQDGKALVVSPSPPLNQQHLACIVGCSRQVLNGSLRKLVRDGIIKMERRRIIVLKPEALRELTYPEIAGK